MDNDSEEQLLKILSNPIRATIIKKLYDDSLTFTHLMQLTGCKTGQLSFHLKKLDYLVEQDELKRYRLSKKGKENVETILPMLGNGEKENNYSWDNLSGEEDNVQLGHAFKQFWASLGLLIFSFFSAVKHGVLYFLNSLKEKDWSDSTNRNSQSLLSVIKGRISSTPKAIRKSLNPILCYFFLILGLLFFIPAVFSFAHPAFDSTIDSAARIMAYEMTPEEISLANELYENEMLLYQRNYQENSYSPLMRKAMYYERSVGFPLSTQKIEAWNEAKVPSRVQFFNDFALSGLGLSLVLLLLGGILAYRRNSLFRRVINSIITTSILLILITLFILLETNAFFAWGNSHLDLAALKGFSLMLKHLIALLFLLLFSSTAWLLFLKTKERKGHLEKELEVINKPFLPVSETEIPSEETLEEETLDGEGHCIEKDQAYLEERITGAGDADDAEKLLAEGDCDGIYCWDEKKGTVDG